jgi:hypothetical protein
MQRQRNKTSSYVIGQKTAAEKIQKFAVVVAYVNLITVGILTDIM